MIRVTVVGNGAVGLFAAMTLARHLDKAEVSVLGTPDRLGCASTAAGAMAAAYAEIEVVP